MFRASKSYFVQHRYVVQKDQLINLITKNQNIAHRRPDDAIYEILRSDFPVVRSISFSCCKEKCAASVQGEGKLSFCS